ncbi:insulinase family protein [Tatumella ptyseos]|uniref:insulinase family protein n=1 Tax=Tatumella ptyseos TaxID=82987 RepID=UPI0026ECD0CB|nr:insulinase family protein [Tatumella ptyseos]WKX25827.1 insulinase family protein [Tatumella ptyseos]
MVGIVEARRYQLSSGLEVNIEQIPHLQRAAVVWIFPVGSHQEPKEWPGLAHLTEHMVFAGGQEFCGQQRLMPWVHQQGGRLNATTQQNYTAYYFEVEPTDLQQGLQRLSDMLTVPRFEAVDLLRETAVIDEEYRLYSHSPQALASAAIHSLVEYPPAFTQFHIGNLKSFGSDITSLGAALAQFHSGGYSLEHSQVWIASPLSCEQQQAEVAQCFDLSDISIVADSSAVSCVAESETISWQNWQGEICLATQPGLGITQVIAIHRLSDWPLFVELMSDTAPGSLCHVISRQLGTHLSVRVERHYHDNQQIFFTLWFEGADFSEQAVQQSLSLWQRWLVAASALSVEQVKHYQQLAEAEALRLPAMDFLREHALGFIFTGATQSEFASNSLLQDLSSIKNIAALRNRPDTRLSKVECQGLYCQFHVTSLKRITPTCDHYPFTFYPNSERREALLAAKDSGQHVPLHYLRAADGGNSLLLRPAPGSAITDRVRAALTQALSPVFSLVKHAGGKIFWQQANGNDVLFIRFDHFADLKNCLVNVINHWPNELPNSSIDGYGALSLRQLLQNMPSILAETFDQWMVSYSGSTQCDAEALQSILSHLPLCWRSFQQDRLFVQNNRVVRAAESDSKTLVAFIPYPRTSRRALMIYQRLAGYYESVFYHQLREKDAVGYAVACRPRVFRERWGLQIILQSSHLSTEQLYQRVELFFEELTLSNEMIMSGSAIKNESCGDEEVDDALQKCLPIEANETEDDGEDFSPERAHHLIIQQVKDKQGGWIFVE